MDKARFQLIAAVAGQTTQYFSTVLEISRNVFLGSDFQCLKTLIAFATANIGTDVRQEKILEALLRFFLDLPRIHEVRTCQNQKIDPKTPVPWKSHEKPLSGSFVEFMEKAQKRGIPDPCKLSIQSDANGKHSSLSVMEMLNTRYPPPPPEACGPQIPMASYFKELVQFFASCLRLVQPLLSSNKTLYSQVEQLKRLYQLEH